MPHVAARTASRDRDTGRYQSHRPEQTLLYQIVDEYYPAFAALMAEQGKELPGYVQREFEEFLQVMRALRKGQASAFYYGDPLGEMRLVSRVFEM
ncbi:hypothetical protein ETE46_00030 [Escherichia coli]|nr:hypothetical protein ETE46_00030 [Escherichia coli]